MILQKAYLYQSPVNKNITWPQEYRGRGSISVFDVGTRFCFNVSANVVLKDCHNKNKMLSIMKVEELHLCDAFVPGDTLVEQTF